MPVVRRGQMKVHTDEEWIQVTKFTAKTGDFTIEMPSYMHAVLRRPEVRGKTLDAVDNAFHKAWREYEDRITDMRKVIVYNISVNAIVYEGDGVESFGKVSFRREDLYWHKGTTGLSVWFRVGYETKNPHDDKPTYVRLDKAKGMGGRYHEMHIPDAVRDIKTIDWTQERQDFFVTLDKELQKLIVRSVEFLETPEKLAALIDRFAGRALPLFEEEDR